jgi:hypothetical protein
MKPRGAFGALPKKIISSENDPFSFKKAGLSIAMIKCLLILAIRNDFYTKETKISQTDLTELTGCSKQMVINALDALVSNKIIKKMEVKKGKTNIYILTFKDEKFSKVPGYLEKILPECTNSRGKSLLATFKLYLILLDLKQSKEDVSRISYTTLVSYGIPKKLIRQAISSLIAFQLIDVRQESIGPTKHLSNVYFIKHLSSREKAG